MAASTVSACVALLNAIYSYIVFIIAVTLFVLINNELLQEIIKLFILRSQGNMIDTVCSKLLVLVPGISSKVVELVLFLRSQGHPGLECICNNRKQERREG